MFNLKLRIMSAKTNFRVKELDNGQKVLQFNAKVDSISDEIRQNSNGKGYTLATISYTDPKGNPQTKSAMVYEKSLAHGIEPGGQYMCTMEKGDNGEVYIRVSHLKIAERATADEFDALLGAFDVAEVRESGDIA